MGYLVLTAAIVASLIAATEIAFRLGRKRARRHGETDKEKGRDYVAERELVSTVQVASLGLLALMLGFTMSMAETRFNQRRIVNVGEANAVTTTFLRSSLLPDPQRTASRELLRRYVAERIAYFHADTPAEVEAATSRGQALTGKLWAHATEAAHTAPDSRIVVSYIESLNNMIDLEATRYLATLSHLPELIHVVLIVIALAAIGLSGYATGLSLARSAFTLYVVPLLVGFTCVMIIDLDQTRWGLIRPSGMPMERAQRTIERNLDVTSAAR